MPPTTSKATPRPTPRKNIRSARNSPQSTPSKAKRDDAWYAVEGDPDATARRNLGITPWYKNFHRENPPWVRETSFQPVPTPPVDKAVKEHDIREAYQAMVNLGVPTEKVTFLNYVSTKVMPLPLMVKLNNFGNIPSLVYFADSIGKSGSTRSTKREISSLPPTSLARPRPDLLQWEREKIRKISQSPISIQFDYFYRPDILMTNTTLVPDLAGSYLRVLNAKSPTHLIRAMCGEKEFAPRA
jgi:hypothetical protein